MIYAPEHFPSLRVDAGAGFLHATIRTGIEDLSIRLFLRALDGGALPAPRPPLRSDALALAELDGVPPDRHAAMGQVHGAAARWIDGPGNFPGTDALLTAEPGLHLLVHVADCVPVFLFAPAGRAVAAIHAGWRGLEAGVVRNAVRSLLERTRTEASALLAWIGPHIEGACYEVGEEVTARFPAEHRTVSARGRPALDLRRAVESQLAALGVDGARVTDAGPCTRCNLHLFPSHRGERGEAARIVGRVGLIR
jgi:YfiH family protein